MEKCIPDDRQCAAMEHGKQCDNRAGEYMFGNLGPLCDECYARFSNSHEKPTPDAAVITITDGEDPLIVIRDISCGRILFSVRPDGTVEFEGTPNEAAIAFREAMNLIAAQYSRKFPFPLGVGGGGGVPTERGGSDG